MVSKSAVLAQLTSNPRTARKTDLLIIVYFFGFNNGGDADSNKDNTTDNRGHTSTGKVDNLNMTVPVQGAISNSGLPE